MKNLKKILLLGGLIFMTPSLSVVKAQDQQIEETRLVGVPKTIIWDLHSDMEQELRAKDFKFPVSFEDTLIWSKPKESEITPVGLTPESFGMTARTFNYQNFISLVLKDGKYGLFPAWAVPQLYLITGYTGNAFWVPTEKTSRGGEIARIGSDQSGAYTSSLRKTKFFPDDPRRSRVNDIWLFTKIKE